MRQAEVFYKDELAGRLTQFDDGTYEFRYEDQWLRDGSRPSISLTLPKTKNPHRSKHLFALFFNMLPEGSNQQVVCRYQRIDKNDHFGILLATASHDTIGAITVKQ